YHKAERGETNLNSTFYFTESDYWGGSGRIRHDYEFGQGFSQRRLLFLMLSPSDNIATRILRRHHGLTGYRQFIEDLGGNPALIQNITYSYLTANEAGFYMREIYRYIQSGGRYSHEFKENLLRNRYPFIISDHPVASKSGWAENFGGAWHDMAIVLAPSPYIVALLSSKAGTTADRVHYDAISMFLQDFNQRWFE
ncbi:MAG: class A beta-lactamase-related serine hydrolase, partial [Defluviitaleaceae bacterium]|nr:class A beta-lactamase-related serine hydrolase [Defluviitaleaceae bacterium]